MAHFHIRPINLPADYEAVARLLTFVRPDAVSAASLHERDQKKPTANDVSYDDAGRLTGYFRVRLVATSADGRQVIGYAEASREYGNLPGDMVESVLVDPEHRHQGIGTALYEQLHAFTLEQRPATIYSLYPDDDMVFQSFAEKRGFCIERHYFTSRLDLTSFEEARFSNVIASVQASGIHFLTLDQWLAESDDKCLYEYVLLAFQDVPGTLQPPPFSTWLDGLNASPENFTIIARDGAQFVGLTQLHALRDSGTAYNSFTGVTRSYRGRNVALALKLLAIRNARQANIPSMSTYNDSENAPMLAINQKLGYERTPGHYLAKKTL